MITSIYACKETSLWGPNKLKQNTFNRRDRKEQPQSTQRKQGERCRECHQGLGLLGALSDPPAHSAVKRLRCRGQTEFWAKNKTHLPQRSQRTQREGSAVSLVRILCDLRGLCGKDFRLLPEQVSERLFHHRAPDLGDGLRKRNVLRAGFHAVLRVAALLDSTVAH